MASKTGRDSLEVSDRQKASNVMEECVKGLRPTPAFFEGTNLMSLRESMQSKKTALSSDIGSALKLSDFTLATATLRDASYFALSPIKLKLLGMHKSLRENFDVAKESIGAGGGVSISVQVNE